MAINSVMGAIAAIVFCMTPALSAVPSTSNDEAPAPIELAAATNTRAAPAKLNSQVIAMKANTWLKLSSAAERPIARSSSPWMPFVPESGVGLLWGCSHGGYHNDVWTYDLAENHWREMLKTEPSAAVDRDVLKYKDGLLMTRLERPLAAHQWGLMDYDPDRDVLWHFGGNWQGVFDAPETYKKNSWTMREEGDPKKHQELLKMGPMLWRYSLRSNHWDRVYTEDKTDTTRNKGLIRYFPPLRKLIMTPSIVSPNGNREQFKSYDPASNKWERLNVAWQAIDKDVSPYWVYGYSPIVYDAKLKALVFILTNGGTWLLDPIAKTMRQVVAKDKTPPANLDGPVGSYVHDSASGTTLAIFADVKTYGADETLKKRGFAADRALVLALDVEKNAWVPQPAPDDEVLPPIDKTNMVHHYYDPQHNATVIYRGPYNSSATETWVYRYKATAK
jgi:hypothetical protein